MGIIAQESRSVPITEDARCSRCSKAIAPCMRLIVARIRTSSKRPITPELLVVCGRCSQLLVLSLHPASQKASAS
jgi:hypothetical protein